MLHGGGAHVFQLGLRIGWCEGWFSGCLGAEGRWMSRRPLLMSWTWCPERRARTHRTNWKHKHHDEGHIQSTACGTVKSGEVWDVIKTMSSNCMHQYKLGQDEKVNTWEGGLTLGFQWLSDGFDFSKCDTSCWSHPVHLPSFKSHFLFKRDHKTSTTSLALTLESTILWVHYDSKTSWEHYGTLILWSVYGTAEHLSNWQSNSKMKWGAVPLYKWNLQPL